MNILAASIFQKGLIPAAAVIAAFLVIAGCGPATAHYVAVEKQLAEGNTRAAAEQFAKARGEYGQKSEVLFNLEMGTLWNYDKAFPASRTHFFAAEKKIDELFTVSISTEAASLAVNDNLLPYSGEDHEKVLVNYFLAMNFAEENEYESALVEARKVDTKLKQISRLYQEKNRYKEDAFIRYVIGVLYDGNGEENDAFIAYRNAFDIYHGSFFPLFNIAAPSALKEDLLRSAMMNNFSEEAETYRSQFGLPTLRHDANYGSLFLVIYSGKGPVKVENRLDVSVQDEKGQFHSFAVAVPKYIEREKMVRMYRATLSNPAYSLQRTTEVATSISGIAVKALEDRLGILYLRTGGRAVLKFLAKQKINEEIEKKAGVGLGGSLLSFIATAAVDATEQADIRTWRTLPATIQIARLYAPPGMYDLSIEMPNGTVISRQMEIKRRGVTVHSVVDIN